ncbi:MAG: hypothetical protein PHC64_00205 [Candidatus Gastranaerophilales bacterium]|nr:hypothetical protein [Candidatus Gastranaerophilales bacterium]
MDTKCEEDMSIIEGLFLMRKDYEESMDKYNQLVEKYGEWIEKQMDSKDKDKGLLAELCYVFTEEYLLLSEMVEELHENYFEQLLTEAILKDFIEEKGLTNEAVKFHNKTQKMFEKMMTPPKTNVVKINKNKKSKKKK